MEESVSAISEMNNGIIEFNKNLNETDLLTNGIGESLKTIAKWTGAAAISLGLKDMVSSLMKINEEATKSAVILGKKAFGKELKENIRDISKNITNLQKEIGVSTEKAKELTNAFLKARITENLHDATAAAAMFERATGAATEDVISMYNEMYHGAKMSTESVNSVMAALSKTQHTLGLTENGMKSVVKTAGNMAIQLRGFGATDKQIQNMTVSLGKYASAMENVGVSAQEATAWVEQLTNPDNIEKNIGLYAQMGISMTDALQGNFDGIQQGEQELAQRIVDMGPIAGAAYAKEFGYSYSKAMKTVNLEAPGQVDIDPQEQAMDSLKQMSEEVLGITGKIEKTFNQLKGGLLGLGPAVLTIMGVVLALAKTKIFPKAKKSIADVVASGIQEGIEGAKVGAGLTGLFKKNFDKANKSGGGYDTTGDKIEIHKTLSASGSNPFKNIMDAETIYHEQVKRAKAENAKAEQTQLAEIRIQRNKAYEAEIQTLEKLKNTLPKDSKAYKKVEDRIELMGSNANSRITSAEELFQRGGKKYHTQAVKDMALQELASKKSNFNADLSQKVDRKNSIESALRIAKHNGPGTKDYEEAMSKLMKETGKSFEDIQGALQKCGEDVGGFGKAIHDTDLSGLDESIQGLKDKVKGIDRKKKRIEDDESLTAPKTGLAGKISNLKEKVSGGFEEWKMKNGGGSFRKAIGNTAGRQVLKLGGLAKSIGKLGLKMGVMAIVANLLKPLIAQLKDKLAPVLDDIQKTVGEVFESQEFKDLMDSLVDIAKDLAPILIDLMKPFMSLFKLLIGLVVKLVNFLLPPLLWVLGQIFRFSGFILEGLGNIPGLGALKEVGASINKAGHEMIDLSGTIGKHDKTIKDNTDVVKSQNDQAAQMRVTSTYGTTSLVERGAAYSVDNSTAETAGAVNNLNKNMAESSKASESAREEQRAVNETIVQSNYDIKQAINRILDRIEGTSGRVQVQMPNS